MNKSTVAYRTVGSAALKPEYMNEQSEPTPIIEFEALVQSNRQQRVYRAPRELSFSEKVSRKVAADPLLGSMSKAFGKPQKSTWANKLACVRCVAGVALATLLLMLIGA